MSHPKQWRNNGGHIEELRDGNWYFIAEVGEVNRQQPEDTERARLIASAPEMLEALELICSIAGESYRSRQEIQDAIQSYASRAIAKAKGE